MGVMDPAEPTSILPADMNDVFQCFERTQPDFLMSNARAVEVRILAAQQMKGKPITNSFGRRIRRKYWLLAIPQLRL